MSRFIVENRQLLIISVDGKIVWKGQPNGFPVTKVIELPGGRFAIVLFDSETWEFAKGLNVSRIDEYGKILWYASDVTNNLSSDPITDISFLDGALFANTWFGKRIAIELKTGIITYLSFTK